MKLSISLMFLFVSLSVFGQSPTYGALVALHHDVDNNMYDLRKDTEPNNEVFWSNIFFNYYKNPKLETAKKNDEYMIFSIGYEYIINSKIEDNLDFKFSFPKGAEIDKIRSYKITFFDIDGTKESKIKRKYVSINETSSILELVVTKEGLPEAGWLKVYCEIESYNFKTLRIAANTNKNIESLLSLNIPIIFRYNIPNLNLTKVDEQTSTFNLKQMTYEFQNPISDYGILSNSTKWKIQNNTSEVITITSISIDLPPNSGSSLEQIMENTN